ncbi:MAG TPA: hypothetical protein IAB55_05570 [Candidatus Merdivicinus faecavium]|nr:hypothetical protein [Candidatus Merdivicinus faecavium]
MIAKPLREHRGQCPVWGIEVAVSGVYGGDGVIWRFLRAECPIVRNTMLPHYRQLGKYALMYCPAPSRCPLCAGFEPYLAE